MFFDANGRQTYPGKVVKTLDWNIANDSALPSWLSAYGTSPVLTFSGLGSSNGRLRCTTKVSSPSIGDAAGIQTAFNLDFSQFEEVSFIAYSIVNDGAINECSVAMESSDSTSGISLFSSDSGAGQAVLRVKPSIISYPSWQFVAESNAARRKDVGITVRPRTKEVFITTGDPYEGAGVIAYDKGNFVAPAANTKPFQLATFVKQVAAQRYIEFAKVKFRTVSN